MSTDFTFQRTARQTKSLVVTSVAVAALVVAVMVLQIHSAIAAVFGVLLVPALWDILVNTSSELTVDDNALTWRMGGRGDTFNLDEVERVRTRLSLDFSQKAAVIMKTGKTRRIPPPCVPPDGSLDAALKARGVAVERSLF